MAGESSHLTVSQAVERLTSPPHAVPMSAQTLRRLAAAGEIPTFRVGTRGDRRFWPKDVDTLKEQKWAEAHPEEQPDPQQP